MSRKFDLASPVEALEQGRSTERAPQMADHNQSEAIERIIEIRCLVGFLGEKSQSNWWPTSFYEASSIRFLEPVFSRTAPLAQYHGTLEAARRFHDEHLSVGTFHLFRLPEELEQDLHETVLTKTSEYLSLDKMNDSEAALDALSKAGTRTDKNGSGPVMVGKIEDIRTSTVLDKLSEIYRAALASNTQVFPYLAG